MKRFSKKSFMKKLLASFMTFIMIISILGINGIGVYAEESKTSIHVNIAVVGMYNEILFQPQNITVTAEKTTVTAEDALKATGLKAVLNDQGMVTSIEDQENGTENAVYGSQSGWMYKVNTKLPMVYPKEQSISDGDYVFFVYMKNYSDLMPSYDSLQNDFIKATVKNIEDGNKFTEEATVLKGQSTHAAIMEALKKHGKDYDKSSLDQEILMTKDQTTSWGYTVNDDKNTYNDTNIQLKNGDKITVFKDDGNGPKEEQSKDIIDSKINALIDGISAKITIDDWAVLDLNKAGKTVPVDHLKDIENNLKKSAGKASATDYERMTLSILAAGGDPTNFAGYNLAEKIYNNTEISAPNAYIFGLLALDAANFTIPQDAKWTKDKLIKAILDCKTEDNGWAYGPGKADPDMTAMALSALAPYYNKKAEVKDAVDKAIDRVSQIQTAKGGFTSWGNENSDSAAMVIIALCDNGIDPTTDSRFIKNGNNVMDALLSYAVKTNDGFGYTDGEKSNGMATEQGLRALAAYKLFKAGQGPVYKGFTLPTPQEPQKQEIKITNLTESQAFFLGSDAKVKVKVENSTNAAQQISFVIALYDKNGSFVNYVCAQQSVQAGESFVLTNMMKLPKDGQYTIKAFVWDSMESMKPLSDVLQFPVQ